MAYAITKYGQQKDIHKDCGGIIVEEVHCDRHTKSIGCTKCGEKIEIPLN